MIEKIGNVELHFDYYSGTDLYSDGDIEDLLLEIAINHERSEFDSVVAEHKSWPVMYHFSSIRQNILNWYPFDKNDNVLEIGAGCGAVTAAIAEKVNSVTCLDLSKRRCLINAERNRDFDNITIYAGNYQDIEKGLGADYDVITLIGVFEYSRGYIHTEDPYTDFLKNIQKHLKPGGKILIAIENRLGMKYWAGCAEDHTGNLFEGIEGYRNTKHVQTFSKSEIEAVLEKAGLKDNVFYYPYPDYKFPMTIYSDRYLPKKGELRNNIANFDWRRLLLFDESEAYDSILDSNLFPVFSNSFFIEARGARS